LAISAVLCAAGVAAQSPSSAPAPAPAPASVPARPPVAAQPATSSDTSDDDFIEFLGADDVGDAAWWEFLKKASPRGENSPAPPPQDAKQ